MNNPIEKIEGRIDKDTMAVAEISESVGGLTFKDMGQVMEFSKLMSVAGQAVPKHLRAQPGACLAVSLQALNWRMDPFAVANKSYMVNDRIAYEAQLIHAVIEQRAPIRGRLKGSYIGEGPDRQCVLRAVSAEDGEAIEYTSPKIKDIKVKNSPLWQSDPDQQLWYYSARAMCRRHFPDVLLGVYEKEEILNAPEMKDVTPQRGGFSKLGDDARKYDHADEMQAEDIEQPGADESAAIDGEVLPPDDQVEIDHTLLEFAEGVTAFGDGKSASDCPYDDLVNKAHWMAGFKRAHEAEAQ